MAAVFHVVSDLVFVKIEYRKAESDSYRNYTMNLLQTGESIL